MKLVYTLALVITIAPAAAAQPPYPAPPSPYAYAAFGVTEHPAIGGSIAVSGSAAGAASDISPEFRVMAETPISMNCRVRADAARVSWTFTKNAFRAEPFTLTQAGLSVLGVAHRGPRVASYGGVGYGLYHFRFRDTRLTHPNRDGVYLIGGLDLAGADETLAISEEVRLHMIDGVHHGGVDDDVLYKLEASIGFKIRF